MADRDRYGIDFEAATTLAECAARGAAFEVGAAELLGRAYLATREREARLVALVRQLGKCPKCSDGYRTDYDEAGEALGDSYECDCCSGTGLVEAARKEVGDG